MGPLHRNKRKNEKENQQEQDNQKQEKKTKYQFAPANNLSASTPLKSIKIDVNVSKRGYNVIEEPKFITNTPSKDLNAPAQVPNLEDRVSWAPTPRADRGTVLSSDSKLPSSPLGESITYSINPINPLPQKYSNLNFDNFGSQKSPEIQRATPSIKVKSESLPSHTKSKNYLSMKAFRSTHLSTPISERPAKLKDIEDLINTVEREFGSKSATSIFNTSALSTCATPSKPTDDKDNAIGKHVYVPKSEDSSDVFDDSEDFLDDLDKALDKTTQIVNIKAEDSLEPDSIETDIDIVLKPDLTQTKNQSSDSLQSVTVALRQNRITSSTKEESIGPPPKSIVKDEIMSDLSFGSSFSDSDDDLFEELLKKTETQAPPLSQHQHDQQVQRELKPLATPLMTTQQRNIHNFDIAGQMLFKQDIESTENKTLKSFRQSNEDLTVTAVVRENVHRFKIVKLIESFYKLGDRKVPQKVLQVVDNTKIAHNIVIRDMWLALDLEPEDVIHVVGESYKLVDKNSDNLLILNPDLLLSATLIGDTLNCSRRSVLKTKFDSRGEYSMALIVGEIVHNIFQSVLKEGDPTPEFMNSKLEEMLEDYLITILASNETKETVRDQVMNHLSYINTWFTQFVKKAPSIASSVKTSNRANKSLFAASNILDIEENIWSPVYGLRGLIDVTIEASLQKDEHNGKFIVPMELKSGAKRIEHEAQTALYTLLMKDRYDLDINFFMLVYTRLKETTKHEINKIQLKNLVIARNKLSVFLKEGVRKLPELKKDSTCDRCFYVDQCMTVNKLTEDGTSENSGLVGDKYNEITGHLTKETYREFYNYWDTLITKEEATLNLLKKELFLIDSETREKTSGKCLCNLVIESSQNDDEEVNGDYLYTFRRSADSSLKSKALSGNQLAKYDRILVSDESGHFALCQGFIVSVTTESITISASRRLKNHNLKKSGFNLTNNQTFETVLKPLDPGQKVNDLFTYRIDKDEMFHGMRLARFNLLNLFLPDGDERRRSLIVDKVKPQFTHTPLHYEIEKNHTFNIDQLQAFKQVLSAKDYSLLLGMPGTGKTTVIAQLIRFLVKNGKTILLTSYTHSAVDNILMKVKNDDFDIIRLGSVSRIHPEVQKFSPLLKDVKTSSQLDDVYLKPPVVATTCLGISDWMFNRRQFDYCIVDESSQVSMPVCLGPLALADKFILVGDHYQLPPLVQNPEASGLSKSLFKILSEISPDSVVELTHQYRMCNDIMSLSNTIIYNGRLKCGSEAVGNQSLQIPNPENLKASFNNELLTSENNWMGTVLDPNRRVLFLNHDEVEGCQELSSKENIQNPKEAELIRQIVEAMILCGIKPTQIGVMSFYRAQLRLFHKIFMGRRDLEKLTADQFQGRDKDCVIISLVKSNDSKDPGTLLKEWRRVNVAITRARSKLIIVGSKSTLQSLKTIDAFMNILASRGWFYNLPYKADLLYRLETPMMSDSHKSPKKASRVTKSVLDSKVIINKPITRDIAEEMGL